jgi:uncharacterized membrane protein
MRYDFRKTGIKLFLISVLVLVLLSKFNVSLNIRLFLGTFFIGSSLFFIIYGKFTELGEDENDGDEDK